MEQQFRTAKDNKVFKKLSVAGGGFTFSKNS
jgi:hypothetical protein